MLYNTNNINNDNQSQTLLDTMKRIMTGSLICEIIFALFNIPWGAFFTWWTALCHIGMGIGYSGQSGLCDMNQSQYCDHDNDCEEVDKCNFNDNWGESEHLEYHCGDLRRYIFAVFINALVTVIMIIVLSVYKCGCCGTTRGATSTEHSSWKYLQWMSIISMGCIIWLIITYFKFIDDTASSDIWNESVPTLCIAIPFYLITFAFRTAIVIKTYRMFQLNKIKKQMRAAVIIQQIDRELANIGECSNCDPPIAMPIETPKI